MEKTQPMESGRNPRKRRTCIECDSVPDTHKSLADQGWIAIEMRVRWQGESHRFFARACPWHHAQLYKALERFERKYAPKLLP